MGLTGQAFTKKHNDQVMEMKRAFLEYMKAIRQRQEHQANAKPEPTQQHKIGINAKGYPTIPKHITERQITKSECKKLIQAYLNWHYCEWPI